MNEALIQTRIPMDIAERIAGLTNTEGLSVASWLRRLVMKEVNRMKSDAWFARKTEIPNTNGPARCYLERVHEFSPTEVEFGLLHGPSHPFPGSPMSQEYLSDFAWYNQQDEHRFFLRGNPSPWSIARTVYDNTSGRMLIVLRIDKSSQESVSHVITKRSWTAEFPKETGFYWYRAISGETYIGGQSPVYIPTDADAGKILKDLADATKREYGKEPTEYLWSGPVNCKVTDEASEYLAANPGGYLRAIEFESQGNSIYSIEIVHPFRAGQPAKTFGRWE